MTSAPRLALLVTLFSSALPAAGAPQPLVLEDPRGDDHGPGSYLPPTGSDYRPGDFDLRRFSVRVEGQDAVIEITLGATVARDLVQQRTNAGDLDLNNGIYVQNVDLYVDTTPGAGFTDGLPGRRIRFAPEEAWDVAMTLTPQPAATRPVLEAWNREAARKVLTPHPVRSSGSTLSVRIPLLQLGGEPKPSWGWSVMVGGATWKKSFDAMAHLMGGYAPDAFTMPVFAIPEEQAFGGATLGGNQPFVLDVILPPGVSQSQVLGAFSASQQAVIPMVYPDPGAHAAAVEHAAKTAPAAPAGAADPGTAVAAAAPADAPVAQPPSPAPAASPPPAPAMQVLEIANVEGDTAVIPAPQGGINTWQIGTVVDAQDRQIGRLIVTNVANGFVVATVSEGKNLVRPGMKVRFAAPRRAN